MLLETDIGGMFDARRKGSAKRLAALINQNNSFKNYYCPEEPAVSDKSWSNKIMNPREISQIMQGNGPVATHLQTQLQTHLFLNERHQSIASEADIRSLFAIQYGNADDMGRWWYGVRSTLGIGLHHLLQEPANRREVYLEERGIGLRENRTTGAWDLVNEKPSRNKALWLFYAEGEYPVYYHPHECLVLPSHSFISMECIREAARALSEIIQILAKDPASEKSLLTQKAFGIVQDISQAAMPALRDAI